MKGRLYVLARERVSCLSAPARQLDAQLAAGVGYTPSNLAA